MSPSPDLDLARVRRFVDQRKERVPPQARDEIRIELDVDDRSATILECGSPWRPENGSEWTRFPIARLRYTKSRKEWALYWQDRNLGFHAYDLMEPTQSVDSCWPRSTKIRPASSGAETRS